MSYRGTAVLCAVVAAISLTACESGQSPTGVASTSAVTSTNSKAADTSAVIARFNGQTLTQQDVQQELDRLNRRSREALQDPERLKQFVENHVLARLIYGQGEKLGYDKNPDIERQVSDLKRRLVIQKVMQEHQSSPVSDEEVKAYYDAHPDEFTTDRVKASHILVKDEATAKEIKAKLDADPSQFESLAKEFSIDKSNASKGGDLGLFGRGRMVKEFEDVAFALEKDGQVSDIVQTRFGFHIIKRTGRENGAAKPFDEVKSQIRVRLINDKRRAQTEEFLDELKKNSNLTMDDKALSGVQVIPPGTEGQQQDEDDGDMPPGH
jgi:peptidyl-prolyl cis-trans isomerase C